MNSRYYIKNKSFKNYRMIKLQKAMKYNLSFNNMRTLYIYSKYIAGLNIEYDLVGVNKLSIDLNNSSIGGK